MLSGPQVILLLKGAVIGVTVIFLGSLLALARGQRRLHGRLNLAFFVLTLVALIGLELVTRLMDPHLFDYFGPETRRALRTHLMFSLPAAAVLPGMVFTGLTRRRSMHLALAVVFCVLWTGTLITGVFFLPSAAQ